MNENNGVKEENQIKQNELPTLDDKLKAPVKFNLFDDMSNNNNNNNNNIGNNNNASNNIEEKTQNNNENNSQNNMDAEEKDGVDDYEDLEEFVI